MSDLRNRLTEISISHGEALRALRAFVDSMREAIGKEAATASNLSERFSKDLESATDTIVLQIEGKDKGLELSRRQFTTIVDALGLWRDLHQQFPKLLLEMAFIYRVALYDAFLPDVLSAVLMANPNMLKSRRKTMTHQEVLEMPDRTSILEAMASKEMHEFAYSSTADQVKWLEDRFGIGLVSSSAEMELLGEIAARRNLLVHTNGVVNSAYLKQVAARSTGAGERLSVGEQYWRHSDELLTSIADKLLVGVANKFLPGSVPPSVRLSRRTQKAIAAKPRDSDPGENIPT